MHVDCIAACKIAFLLTMSRYGVKSYGMNVVFIPTSSQEAEAELEAAHPPPLLVVDVALVGRAQRRRGLPVQHGHPVDGAPVLGRGWKIAKK